MTLMDVATAPVSTRRYRGSTAEERSRERRAKLIEAAFQVYGAVGYRNATVKMVCDAAGLTERYFYESFANSEDLLAAAYREGNRLLLEEVRAAGAAVTGDRDTRIAAMLRCYFEGLARDPASARLFLIELAGVSPTADEALAQALEDWGQLIEETVAAPNAAPRALRMGVNGGLHRIALDWVLRGCTQPIDELVDAGMRLCLLLEVDG